MKYNAKNSVDSVRREMIILFPRLKEQQKIEEHVEMCHVVK